MFRRGAAEGEAERSAFLDLHHGECRQARSATAEDLAAADFVIAGRSEVWDRLLGGKLDPIWALVSGRLDLERGSLARLTPQVRAARELVRAARRITGAAPGAETAGLPAAAPGGNRLVPAAMAPRPGAAARRSFQTTGPRGLDRELVPFRLFQKAKRFGIWDPAAIDFAVDRRDWVALADDERDVLLRLTSLFQGGEEAVTLDLLPLIQVIAEEGRLEEEIYLTSFLWEEAKHVEAFRRFLDEVAHETGDLSRYESPAYRRIFFEELPRALTRLRTDPSPVAQAAASVTYNMIVEGVLAETGYHAYHSVLDRNGILPGMQTVVGHLKTDESRHLAYGVHLLSRLVAEHGDPVWEVIEARMERLLEPALEVVEEVFAAYPVMPFGLRLEEFTEFAVDQFRRRLTRVGKARGRTLADVVHEAD